jgi:hypothetical protein
MCGCAPRLPAKVWMILFIFGIQEFVRHRSMPDESQHSNSKNRGPETEKGDVLETVLTILIEFQ